MFKSHAFSHQRPLIEPLEQRIAPALLVAGANLLGGAGNAKTGETSIGGNSVTLVKVISGEAIVWFYEGRVSAISVGPNTSLDITGDVGIVNGLGVLIPGPIIGNLTASGKLTDSDNNAANGLDGGVLLPNNILGITTHPLGPELGTVGNIITGGSVSNVNISGNLSGIFAGTGAFYSGSSSPLLNSHVLSGGLVVAVAGADVNPILPGVQPGFVFAASNVKTVESGAFITNVKMGAAEALEMFAGDGAAGTAGAKGHPIGLPGGSISHVTITSAFVNPQLAPTGSPTYVLMAGNGGAGSRGGAGGSIQYVTEISSSGIVDLFAGQGGAALTSAGGAGGSIKTLNMESDGSAYTVQAGHGGIGAPGGPGGTVKGVNFGGDQLSNGILVSAPFTGGTANDILLVDAQTGTMVIEQNNGNGTGFTPVVQDSISLLDTIAAVGTTPVAAVAVDVNGDGLPDIVVAYKNTDSLGVYINQGGGVFYKQDFTGGTYNGDSVQATTVTLPYAPTQLAAGNFMGDGSQDLAVTLNKQGTAELMALQGNGQGSFTVPSSMMEIPANPVSLVPANIQGGNYSDLFVGFKNGLIDSMLATGSTTSAPFNVVNSGITVPGGLLNLDYNPVGGLLLALDGSGSNLDIYTPGGSGALTALATIPLTAEPGTGLVAHFIPGFSPAEQIEVLTSVGSGSRLDFYSQQGNTFTLTSSVQSAEALKNFVPVVEGLTSGVAAVGNSVEHFAFSQNGGPFYDVGLPFSGKTVHLAAGDGGDGLTTEVARGGAGGMVYGMSVLAGQITIQAGNGGSSQNAPGGAGGMVVDTPFLLSAQGKSVPAILEADSKLIIDAGSGGSASGTAHGATGGAGGVVKGLNLSLLAGDITVDAGDGGNGSDGSGGSGGAVSALKSVAYGGALDVTGGIGGAALGAAGNGGAGGSILNLTHALTLADQAIEASYAVSLVAGAGGQSVSGSGGAGGSIGTVAMTLQTPNESVTDPSANPSTLHADVDSTLRVAVTAGNGGNGAVGGSGGSLKKITSTSIFDQVVTIQGVTSASTVSFPEINPVTADLTSGNGGNGAKGAGGAGGAINTLDLVGITHYDLDDKDPQAGQVPLVITSGNGGNGATFGGPGGAIVGVNSQNAQLSSPGTTTGGMTLSGTELSEATVISGHGGNGGSGNGGVGGLITKLSIGVSGFNQQGPLTTTGSGYISGGQMTIQSGAGGNGGTAGKGGAAGSLTDSSLGCANAYEQYGLLFQTGAGGSGALAGGKGGDVINITLNAPQNAIQGSDAGNTAYDVLSTLILAGNGGAATGASAVGGMGGSISHVSQSSDVNTSINILQAGNGGAAAHTGGAGGSVFDVNTVGLIGQASDDSGHSFGAFQTFVAPGVLSTLFPAGVPEGVFAGRGGTGATAGIAGSVTSITAAQIAAIGAAANANGLFAAASKVANITAEAIGYDVNGNGLYDNATGTNRTAPDQAVAIDGFIFSVTAPTGVSALNKAFTFAPA